MKTYIGIDNGVTGLIGVIYPDGRATLEKIPTFSTLNYQKTKAKYITRINHTALSAMLFNILSMSYGNDTLTVIERPMVNPGRFVATASALRALEATIICLEKTCMPYQFIDSKQWQRSLLPSGIQKDELKSAAVDIAKRLFPQIETKDADGILIAEYARRNNL